MRPDLGTFCRLDELGLEVLTQCLEPGRAVVGVPCAVAPNEFDRWCGAERTPRDTVTRCLAQEPFGWRPTALLVTMRRYRVGHGLAGDALDRCRQRVQQQTCVHRGRTGRPLYGIRRALRTGTELLTAFNAPAWTQCSPTKPTSRSRSPGPAISAS